MSDPIATLDEARRELEETMLDVSLDQGWDKADEGHADLVRVVADRCTPEVAAELCRTEGVETADDQNWRVAMFLARVSERELETLLAIARGLTEQQAAEYLHVERSTVHHHLRNVRAKLGAKTTSQAIFVAAKRGLLR